MDNTANDQQGINVAEGTENNQKQEKLFTQADLDRIIGERLARVKTEASPELQARERECTRRELRIEARERLADAGLPKELLSALNCSTKEDMENSIKTIQSLYGKENMPANNDQRKTGVYRVCNTTNTKDDPATIRRAMGLKG